MKRKDSIAKRFTILISDRNRNVREYLRREFTAEGYRVRVAKSAWELLEWLYQDDMIDIIILDPELPYASDMSLLKTISDWVPAIPVVVHSFNFDYGGQLDVFKAVNFVEKRGSSIEYLKKEVLRLLTDKGST